MENKKWKYNWPLLGNRAAIDFLDKSISNNSLAQAYIFNGQAGIGKSTIARYFAQNLLGQTAKVDDELENLVLSGDLHIVAKAEDKKNISVDQIRELIKVLGLGSFGGKYKIGIVKQAEALSQEASNALLKTLEEPQPGVVIILLCANLEALPQTIASRAQVLNFVPVASDLIYDYLLEKHKTNRSTAKNLAHLSAGRPALAIKFLEDKDFYNDYLNRVQDFLRFMDQDIMSRWQETAKQLSVEETIRSLDVWQGLCRDMLLINLRQENLIQHNMVLDELRTLAPKFSLAKINNQIEEIGLAKEYLMANVGPRNVLDKLLINITI